MGSWAAQKFGELRALMQYPAPAGIWEYACGHPVEYSDEWVEGEAWRACVCALILDVSRRDPKVYSREWLPYLASFPQHWRLPLAVQEQSWQGSSRFSWELHGATASFACFGFQAISNAMNGSRFRDPAKCKVLAATLKDFTHVNFSDHAIMTEGAVALAGCDELSHLTHLVLAGCHIRDEGVLALARSPHLQRLELLDVSGCGVSDEAIVALCEERCLERLHTLRLADNTISEEGLRLLVTRPLQQLEVLDVSGDGSLSRAHLDGVAWWRDRSPALHVELGQSAWSRWCARVSPS
jgi:hypothetical protein